MSKMLGFGGPKFYSLISENQGLLKYDYRCSMIKLIFAAYHSWHKKNEPVPLPWPRGGNIESHLYSMPLEIYLLMSPGVRDHIEKFELGDIHGTNKR